MKNLLLSPTIFALASEQEVGQFEKAMKTNNNWNVNTIHRKGDYLVSCSYNYSDFLEGFETPVKADIENGMFCIYSTIEKRIVMILVFGENDSMSKPKEAESMLGDYINKLIKEYHNEMENKGLAIH